MAIKKTFEQRVAEVTATTVELMICNALYHYTGSPVYPQRTITASPTLKVIANATSLESFSKEDKLAALSRYAANADWSAFKKWDCQAAVNSLNA